jgi:hypothetical protein
MMIIISQKMIIIIVTAVETSNPTSFRYVFQAFIIMCSVYRMSVCFTMSAEVARQSSKDWTILRLISDL